MRNIGIVLVALVLLLFTIQTPATARCNGYGSDRGTWTTVVQGDGYRLVNWGDFAEMYVSGSYNYPESTGMYLAMALQELGAISADAIEKKSDQIMSALRHADNKMFYLMFDGSDLLYALYICTDSKSLSKSMCKGKPTLVLQEVLHVCDTGNYYFTMPREVFHLIRLGDTYKLEHARR